MERVQIVNEQDECIALKERRLLEKGDIFRATALWVLNSNNELLLGRRSPTKLFNPNKWSSPVSGTVVEGETYFTNVVKEAQEELGLTHIVVREGSKIFVQEQHKFYCQWFFTLVNKSVEEFVVDELEIAELRWFSKDDLQKAVTHSPNQFIQRIKEFPTELFDVNIL